MKEWESTKLFWNGEAWTSMLEMLNDGYVARKMRYRR